MPTRKNSTSGRSKSEAESRPELKSRIGNINENKDILEILEKMRK